MILHRWTPINDLLVNSILTLLVAYQDPCDWGATYMKTWPVLGPVAILKAGLGQF